MTINKHTLSIYRMSFNQFLYNFRYDIVINIQAERERAREIFVECENYVIVGVKVLFPLNFQFTFVSSPSIYLLNYLNK